MKTISAMKKGKLGDIKLLKRTIGKLNGTLNTNTKECFNNCNCGLENVLPEKLLIYLVIIVLFVRIYYVCQPQNWWLLHPDEIFQSTEVAFSEAYGYGFRTYEYCPPVVNISTPVEEQETRQGMYSLRSMLFPYFFAIFFTISKSLGLPINPYLSGRIIQSVVSSFTIIAVYRISKTVFTCRGIASLSAITTAFSLHLSVFGTHTLINSFISPVLFFFLDFILANIVRLEKQEMEYDTVEHGSSNVYVSQPKPQSYVDNLNNNDKRTDGKVRYRAKLKNNSIVVMKETNQNNRKGVCKNFENSIARYHQEQIHVFALSLKLLISGFFIALVCYCRPDTSIFVLIVGLCFLIAFHDVITFEICIRIAIMTGTGFVAGMTVGGAVDLYTYGSWFLTPLQWSRLNAASHIPSTLYGAHSPHQYILDIFVPSYMDMCLNIFYGLALIVTCFISPFTHYLDQRSFSSLFVSACVVLFMYSMVGHKELRFVHNLIVVINILYGYALHGILQYSNTFIYLAKRTKEFIVISFSVIAVLNCYINFPTIDNHIILPWNTVTPSDSAEINQCLNFIGQQQNATGVFLDGSIYMTAGYSILNHDVPIIALIHHEYHEYKPGEYKMRNDLYYKAPKNLRVVNRYSDLIDVSDTHYLSKRLLQSLEYNYAVIPKRKVANFNRIGFKASLFSSGKYAVQHRGVSKDGQRKLLEMGQNMTLGINATILEYEASWLYTAGKYEKAITRLERAIELSDQRIRPFQILAASYAHQNNFTHAKVTEDKCSRKHGRSACRQPQPRIVIHDEYNDFSLN